MHFFTIFMLFSGASELLKTPFIEVEHNDELHKILITKPRSRINSHTAQKECATTSQKGQNALHIFLTINNFY